MSNSTSVITPAMMIAAMVLYGSSSNTLVRNSSTNITTMEVMKPASCVLAPAAAAAVAAPAAAVVAAMGVLSVSNSVPVHQRVANKQDQAAQPSHSLHPHYSTPHFCLLPVLTPAPLTAQRHTYVDAVTLHWCDIYATDSLLWLALLPTGLCKGCCCPAAPPGPQMQSQSQLGYANIGSTQQHRPQPCTPQRLHPDS